MENGHNNWGISPIWLCNSIQPSTRLKILKHRGRTCRSHQEAGRPARLQFLTLLSETCEARERKNHLNEVWPSLVGRVLWEHQAVGSNPATPTMLSVHNASELWTLSFSIYSTYLIFVCRGAGSVSLLVFVRRSRYSGDIRPRRRDGYRVCDWCFLILRESQARR